MRRFTMFVLGLLILSFIVGGSSKVEAVPFINVQSFVTPTFGGPGVDLSGTTTFSAVGYTFSVIQAEGGAEMNLALLQFESAVFPFVGAVTAVNPGDWIVTESTLGGHIFEFASGGTALGAGEALSFIVNDVEVFTLALSDSTYWSESQIWAQGWVAGDGDLFNPTDSSTWNALDGGSTVPTPEPTSLLLLGSGLVGLRLLRRKKFKRTKA